MFKKITRLFYNIYTVSFFSRLVGNHNYILNYYRSFGVSIGENCHIYSSPVTPESFLVHIGDNVTISTNVTLLTHDNSACILDNTYTDFFGEINICNNCFIGSGSIILPGVTIGNNVIIGAGSVVTRSIPSNVVAAGNPAKILGQIDDYTFKLKDNLINACSPQYLIDRKVIILENSDKWIKRTFL